jgi:hypothetical protein
MKKQITPVFALLLVATGLFAQKIPGSTTAEQALQKANKQFFIENKGQWHPDVLYLTRMGGLDVWITKYGVNYTFYKIEKNPHAKKADILLSKFDHDMEDATLLGHRVLMKLQNHRAILCPRASKSNRAITITSLATTRANTPRTWAYTKKPW